MRFIAGAILSVVLTSFAFAAGPPPPPPGPTAIDLGIVKIAEQHLPGDTATFILAVTNYGPVSTGTGIVGNIVVTDQLPAPATFLTPLLPANWSCMPPSGQSITCTFDVPLGVGQTAQLPLTIAMPAGQTGTINNCASVHGGIFIPELDPSNNNDCTCIDFKACRGVSIDISTGRFKAGTAIALGQPDPDWRVVSGPAAGGIVLGPAITAVRATPWLNASGFNAQWISIAGTDTDAWGDYVYDFPFLVGPQWRNCTATFDYAADNEVQFQLVNGPVLAQTPGYASPNPSGATVFVNLQGPVTHSFTPQPGLNILRARVQNGDPSNPLSFTGPTGLFVNGKIDCTCGQ
jgi:uncharacterized repeat protein (TIGR01451 family)